MRPTAAVSAALRLPMQIALMLQVWCVLCVYTVSTQRVFVLCALVRVASHRVVGVLLVNCVLWFLVRGLEPELTRNRRHCSTCWCSIKTACPCAAACFATLLVCLFCGMLAGVCEGGVDLQPPKVCPAQISLHTALLA